MQFEDYLSSTRDNIHTQLTTFVTNWLAQAEKLAPHVKHVLSAFEEQTKGGKGIRGALVCLGADLKVQLGMLYVTGFFT